MNVSTNCPNCGQAISMDVPGNPPPLMNLLHMVHCTPCSTLFDSRSRTKQRIESLQERIRHSTDKEEIERLTGSLTAQYTSQKMLTAKIEDKQATTHEKDSIDKPAPTSLPW